MNAPNGTAGEVAAVRAALARARPGALAHVRMAPRLVGEDGVAVTALDRVPGPDVRAAAVLLVLCERPEGLELLFIRRPVYDGEHSGQIAFPGGRREGDESLDQTALRETHEELGIEPARIELLGALSPLFVWVSNHLVAPYVGLARGPLELRPCTREVADVFAVPLSRLRARRYHGAELVSLKRGRAWAPYFALPGTRLWGASAMMLIELVSLLDGHGGD